MEASGDEPSRSLASLVGEDGLGWVYGVDPSGFGWEFLDIVTDEIRIARDADAEPETTFSISAILSVRFEHLVPLDVAMDDEWDWLNSRWDAVREFLDERFEVPSAELHDEVTEIRFMSVTAPADATLGDALVELRRRTDVAAFVRQLTTDVGEADRFPNELARDLTRYTAHDSGD